MSTVNGLPAHALLVHLVVVLIPLTAILLILVAFWPSARRRLSVLTAVFAALSLISVPITTDAGEWLERHVERTPLVRDHTHLGDTMLPWAIGLFLVAAALAVRETLRGRAQTPGHPRADGPGTTHAAVVRAGGTRSDGMGGRAGTVVLAVLALLVALGSTVTVYRIGESGARAAWTGQFSQQPLPQPGHSGPAAGS
jgi:hypothetical protein